MDLEKWAKNAGLMSPVRTFDAVSAVRDFLVRVCWQSGKLGNLGLLGWAENWLSGGMNNLTGCFVISKSGLYWNGRDWVAKARQAMRWHGFGDPWQRAKDLTDRFRANGVVCDVAYVFFAEVDVAQFERLGAGEIGRLDPDVTAGAGA